MMVPFYTLNMNFATYFLNFSEILCIMTILRIFRKKDLFFSLR